jgi:hypothetical protein
VPIFIIRGAPVKSITLTIFSRASEVWFDGPWPSVVLRAIEVAQSFGKSWGSGAVQDEIDLSASGGFAIAGIQFAGIAEIAGLFSNSIDHWFDDAEPARSVGI